MAARSHSPTPRKGRLILDAILAQREIPVQTFASEAKSVEDWLNNKDSRFVTQHRVPSLDRLLSGIDIQAGWSELTDGDRELVWNYLKIWYLLSKQYDLIQFSIPPPGAATPALKSPTGAGTPTGSTSAASTTASSTQTQTTPATPSPTKTSSNGEWNCARCTFTNPSTATTCGMCSAVREPLKPAGPAVPSAMASPLTSSGSGNGTERLGRQGSGSVLSPHAISGLSEGEESDFEEEEDDDDGDNVMRVHAWGSHTLTASLSQGSVAAATVAANAAATAAAGGPQGGAAAGAGGNRAGSPGFMSPPSSPVIAQPASLTGAATGGAPSGRGSPSPGMRSADAGIPRPGSGNAGARSLNRPHPLGPQHPAAVVAGGGGTVGASPMASPAGSPKQSPRNSGSAPAGQGKLNENHIHKALAILADNSLPPSRGGKPTSPHGETGEPDDEPDRHHQHKTGALGRIDSNSQLQPGSASKTSNADQPGTREKKERERERETASDRAENNQRGIRMSTRYCTEKGFRWKLLEKNNPNLIFPLRAIDDLDIHSHRMLFHLNMANSHRGPLASMGLGGDSNEGNEPEFSLVEKEKAVHAYPLRKVGLVTRGQTKYSIAVTILSHTRETRSFQFFNRCDYDDVLCLLKPVSEHNFKGFKFQQMQIHQGFARIRGKERHLRLYTNRLQIHRDDSTLMPMQVVPLSGTRGRLEVAQRDMGLSIDGPSPGDDKLNFDFEGIKERDTWLLALGASQRTRFSVPSLLSPLEITAKEKDRNEEKKRLKAEAEVKKKDAILKLKRTLQAMNRDQTVYFEFINQFRNDKIFHMSHVWDTREWEKHLPHKALRSRGKKITAIDQAVDGYSTFVQLATAMLSKSRVACQEIETESGNSSQIDFAFPGFDGQVFDVGRYAVVTAWKFFAGISTPGGGTGFEDADWNGALQSKCAAKELMQTSPDVSKLFDVDPKGAKQVMFDNQLEVLHNLFLASFMHRMGRDYHEDVIPWMKVVDAVIVKDANRKYVTRWRDLSYILNPSQSRTSTLLRVHTTRDKLAGTPDKPATTPSNAASAALAVTEHPEPDLRLLCDPTRFVLFLRTLMTDRMSMLRPLGELVDIWCDTHSSERSDKEKYTAVSKLKELVDSEKKEIVAVLVKLPGNNVLNKALGIPKSEWYGSIRGARAGGGGGAGALLDEDEDEDDDKALDDKPSTSEGKPGVGSTRQLQKAAGAHGTLLRNQAHAVFENRHHERKRDDGL